MGNNEIFNPTVFDGITINAGESQESEILDMDWYKPNGDFSLHVVLTGDGTGKLEYQISNSREDFHTPSDAKDIVTSHTKTSGPGNDGKDTYSFDPKLARFMRFKASETGEANSISLTAVLAIQ